MLGAGRARSRHRMRSPSQSAVAFEMREIAAVGVPGVDDRESDRSGQSLEAARSHGGPAEPRARGEGGFGAHQHHSGWRVIFFVFHKNSASAREHRHRSMEERDRFATDADVAVEKQGAAPPVHAGDAIEYLLL